MLNVRLATWNTLTPRCCRCAYLRSCDPPMTSYTTVYTHTSNDMCLKVGKPCGIHCGLPASVASLVVTSLLL